MCPQRGLSSESSRVRDEVLALGKSGVNKSLQDSEQALGQKAAKQGRRPDELCARHEDHRAQFSH